MLRNGRQHIKLGSYNQGKIMNKQNLKANTRKKKSKKKIITRSSTFLSSFYIVLVKCSMSNCILLIGILFAVSFEKMIFLYLLRLLLLCTLSAFNWLWVSFSFSCIIFQIKCSYTFPLDLKFFNRGHVTNCLFMKLWGSSLEWLFSFQFRLSQNLYKIKIYFTL